MPKEQGHFGERVARSTSKTAKNKSNSDTRRASQGGTHRGQSGMGVMRNRRLRCDSEKDSGYSGERWPIWMIPWMYEDNLTDLTLPMMLTIPFHWKRVQKLSVCCVLSILSYSSFSLSPLEAGSDSVHNDVDDQRSSVSEPHRESSKSSNNRVNTAGHNMAPYEERTPIYVIKNLVVKPVRYSVLYINLLFQAFCFFAS